MCGIGAIFHFDGRPVETGDMVAMCSALAHRGPDGAAFARLNGGNVALAHVRLSLVDLAGGAQPLFNEDETVVVVCNGEIYDHAEQRQALQAAGHVFSSRSDSELLIHLYERDGADFIANLNGEFAFVLWDARRRVMIAARDRSGVKPLFYCVQPGRLAISSEVKGMMGLAGMPRALAQEYFMTAGLGVVSADTCAFAGISSLKPGHFIVTDANGAGEERPFHRWEFAPRVEMRFDDAAAMVGEAVRKSVHRRLQADVPVHCYLSGGLDSGIICGLMAEQTSRLSAYHVSFPGTPFDEAGPAGSVAQHFGAELKTIDCTPEALTGNLVRAVEHVELPLANCNAVGKFLLSALVRSDGQKACLTGEGADEAFGGYPYFKLEAIWHAALGGRIDARMARQLTDRMRVLDRRSLGSVWHETNAWRDPAAWPYGRPAYLHLRAREVGRFAPFLFGQNLAAGGPAAEFLTLFPPDHLARIHPFNATRVMAFASLAGGLIPPLGDRVEMAHSIECRTPFLDPDLLQLTTAIPPEHFIDLDKLREKRLLHSAFQDLLPSFMHASHKHPFLAPSWRSVLRTRDGQELVREYLGADCVRRAGIYRPRAVAMLRKLWAHLPSRSSVVRHLDPLIGIMLTGHILHERFVEERWRPSRIVEPADRSPGPAPARKSRL